MKKTIIIIAVALCLIMGLTTLSGCIGGEKDILVICREDGSGTRDAFDGLIKDAEGASLLKDKDGNNYSASPIVASAEILNKTGDVMTKVGNTKTAIGYISLGSLNSTVKALSVNGVEATSANVLNDSYKLKRPFVIVNSNSVTLTAAAVDFKAYLLSIEAQAVVVAQNYVEQVSSTNYVAPTSALSGTVVIKGSTSVDPIMDKLIADYKLKGGANVAGIEFNKDAQGSSHGVTAAKNDTVGNVIGMSSSSIKSADATSLEQFNVALDAVAIIVNNANTLTNITIEQLFKVYTGTITKFSELE